jgi:hypothetical protein
VDWVCGVLSGATYTLVMEDRLLGSGTVLGRDGCWLLRDNPDQLPHLSMASIEVIEQVRCSFGDF